MNIDPELVTAFTPHQDRSGLEPTLYQGNLKTALGRNFNGHAGKTGQLHAPRESSLLGMDIFIIRNTLGVNTCVRMSATQHITGLCPQEVSLPLVIHKAGGQKNNSPKPPLSSPNWRTEAVLWVGCEVPLKLGKRQNFSFPSGLVGDTSLFLWCHLFPEARH